MLAQIPQLRYILLYALNQERYLNVHLTDGDVPIDNNTSKRAIRGFCVGKKNWQMIDTMNGAASQLCYYLQHRRDSKSKLSKAI